MVQKKSEEYKGKHILYEEKDPSFYGQIEVEITPSIGDGHVHTIRMKNGRYGTHLLPYRDYSSIPEMAHDIIDKVPAFSGKHITSRVGKHTKE